MSKEAGNGSHEDTKKAGAWVRKPGFVPIRYDGVLARSLPQLARLRIASFPPPLRRDLGNRPSGRSHGITRCVNRLEEHRQQRRGDMSP